MNFRVWALVGLVAGCSPTLDDLPKLSDEDVVEAPQTLSAAPAPDADAPLTEQSDVQAAIAEVETSSTEPAATGGLFGMLRRAAGTDTRAQQAEAERLAAIAPKAEVLPQSDLVLDDPAARPVVPVGDETPVLVPSTVAAASIDTPQRNIPASLPAPQTQEAAKAGNLFGFLRRNPAPDQDPTSGLVDDTKAADVIQPADTSDAVVTEAAVVQTPSTAPARRGLFAPRKPSVPTGPDAAQVPLGTALPYGEIARVCGVGKNKLGREIGRFPDNGRGYRLYDSNPGSTTLRPHYITGFADGCTRQFSAALALFGGTEFHEQVRYERSSRDFAYTPTDLAYEKLKSQVCRVGTNTPCPPNRVDRLQKDTVFVTVYERFGNNPRWADILLHDGEVLAKDIKSR